MEIIDEFPRVHWPVVRKAVEPYKNHPAIDAIWTEIAAQWLAVIRDHLGGRYRIYRGKHLFLLSAGEPRAVRRTLALGDAAYERLDGVLCRTAEERGLGKHVVLMLDTQKIYYDYISYFYAESEREYGMSAGKHLGTGYRHTVVNAVYRHSEHTMVHELAHNMVTRRPLPLWLNEGLAQTMEDMVPGKRPPMLNAKHVRAHRRYWEWFGIERFWNGTAFRAGGGRRLSYELSDILFRNLVVNRKRRKGIGVYSLQSAHRDDAGAAALLAGVWLPAAGTR